MPPAILTIRPIRLVGFESLDHGVLKLTVHGVDLEIFVQPSSRDDGESVVAPTVLQVPVWTETHECLHNLTMSLCKDSNPRMTLGHGQLQLSLKCQEEDELFCVQLGHANFLQVVLNMRRIEPAEWKHEVPSAFCIHIISGDDIVSVNFPIESAYVEASFALASIPNIWPEEDEDEVIGPKHGSKAITCSTKNTLTQRSLSGEPALHQFRWNQVVTLPTVVNPARSDWRMKLTVCETYSHIPLAFVDIPLSFPSLLGEGGAWLPLSSPHAKLDDKDEPSCIGRIFVCVVPAPTCDQRQLTTGKRDAVSTSNFSSLSALRIEPPALVHIDVVPLPEAYLAAQTEAPLGAKVTLGVPLEARLGAPLEILPRAPLAPSRTGRRNGFGPIRAPLVPLWMRAIVGDRMKPDSDTPAGKIFLKYASFDIEGDAYLGLPDFENLCSDLFPRANLNLKHWAVEVNHGASSIETHEAWCRAYGQVTHSSDVLLLRRSEHAELEEKSIRHYEMLRLDDVYDDPRYASEMQLVCSIEWLLGQANAVKHANAEALLATYDAPLLAYLDWAGLVADRRHGVLQGVVDHTTLPVGSHRLGDVSVRVPWRLFQEWWRFKAPSSDADEDRTKEAARALEQAVAASEATRMDLQALLPQNDRKAFRSAVNEFANDAIRNICRSVWSNDPELLAGDLSKTMRFLTTEITDAARRFNESFDRSLHKVQPRGQEVQAGESCPNLSQPALSTTREASKCFGDDEALKEAVFKVKECVHSLSQTLLSSTAIANPLGLNVSTLSVSTGTNVDVDVPRVLEPSAHEHILNTIGLLDRAYSDLERAERSLDEHRIKMNTMRLELQSSNSDRFHVSKEVGVLQRNMPDDSMALPVPLSSNVTECQITDDGQAIDQFVVQYDRRLASLDAESRLQKLEMLVETHDHFRFCLGPISSRFLRRSACALDSTHLDDVFTGFSVDLFGLNERNWTGYRGSDPISLKTSRSKVFGGALLSLSSLQPVNSFDLRTLLLGARAHARGESIEDRHDFMTAASNPELEHPTSFIRLIVEGLLEDMLKILSSPRQEQPPSDPRERHNHASLAEAIPPLRLLLGFIFRGFSDGGNNDIDDFIEKISRTLSLYKEIILGTKTESAP